VEEKMKTRNVLIVALSLVVIILFFLNVCASGKKESTLNSLIIEKFNNGAEFRVVIGGDALFRDDILKKDGWSVEINKSNEIIVTQEGNSNIAIIPMQNTIFARFDGNRNQIDVYR
jgi:hypothetical protein